MNYISTKNMTHEEWLKARQNGIGGSDSWRIVLPESDYRYAGCGKLYREKTADEINDEPTLQARVGTYLEEFVAQEYQRATGNTVHRWNRIIYSDAHPFMFANIDRKLYAKNEGLECKTIGTFAARRRIIDEESGEVKWIDRFIEGDMEASLSNKLEWYIQMQHYMAVTGWEMWHLAVLIGNERFLWYDVPRDEEYIKVIIEKEEEFWGYVQRLENIWEE